MCCCCLPRCSIICASVWTLANLDTNEDLPKKKVLTATEPVLPSSSKKSRVYAISLGVQSILWAVLAAVGIFLYTCDIQVQPDITNPVYYLYFIYFYNSECDDIPTDLDFENILINVFTPPPYSNHFDTFSTPFPLPQWPLNFTGADYTHGIMKFYVGFNAGWAVTCIIAIVAACMNVRKWFAYVPWILLTAANIVLDVIATVQYVNDAIASETLWGLLETVIGVNLDSITDGYRPRFQEEMDESFSEIGGITSIPSIVMLAITIRLGVFWLLNILLLICVLISVCRLPHKKGKLQ